MIYINKQLNSQTAVEATPQNFPRLYDGAQRVRDISIIEYENSIDIQTILNAAEIRAEIAAFLRRKHQGRI